MPTTNSEPIPGFDAVAESRKWREATSHLLNSMSREERIAYLNAARARYLSTGKIECAELVEEDTCILREEPPK